MRTSHRRREPHERAAVVGGIIGPKTTPPGVSTTTGARAAESRNSTSPLDPWCHGASASRRARLPRRSASAPSGRAGRPQHRHRPPADVDPDAEHERVVDDPPGTPATRARSPASRAPRPRRRRRQGRFARATSRPTTAARPRAPRRATAGDAGVPGAPGSLSGARGSASRAPPARPAAWVRHEHRESGHAAASARTHGRSAFVDPAVDDLNPPTAPRRACRKSQSRSRLRSSGQVIARRTSRAGTELRSTTPAPRR